MAIMDQEWILQTRDTRRTFATSTWVPLRASQPEKKGEALAAGLVKTFFGCGSVAFPEEHRETAERLDWSDLGLARNVEPYAYDDGHYLRIDQFQYRDKEPIGVNLVFEHPQEVLGGRLWILNPDLAAVNTVCRA